MAWIKDDLPEPMWPSTIGVTSVPTAQMKSTVSLYDIVVCIMFPVGY